MSDELAKLWVVIGARTDEFKAAISGVNKDLGKAEKDFKKTFGNIMKATQNVGKEMTVAGAAITAPIALAVTDFASTSDNLDEMSQRTGLSTDALQEFGYAADLTGSSIDGLETSIKRMQVNIALGSKSVEELGVDLSDLQDLKPEEQFEKLADMVASVEDPAERSALAVKLFGKSGTDMIPMFVSGLKKLRQEARDVGAVISKDTVQSGAKLQDSFDKVEASIKGVTRELASLLAGPLGEIVEDVAEVVKNISEWTKQNPELTKSIVLITAALGGIMTVLGPILVVLPGLMAAISLIGPVLAALTGPIGLVVAGIVGLGVAIGVIVSNWDTIGPALQKMLNDMGNWFANIGATISNAWPNMQTALGNLWNNLVNWLAGKSPSTTWDWSCLWNGINNAWTNMSNALSNLWGQLTGWFNIHGVSVAWDWSTLWQGISEVWGNVQTALGGLWNQITGWFSSHMPDFTHLWDGVLTAWDNFKTFSLDSVKGLLNNLVTTINNAIFWINQNIINPLKQFNIAGWYPFSGMGYVSYIPKLAEGGIVTSPTLAMVGEAGPEAVIPLDKMGTGNVVHLHVGAMMGNETDARKFARLITDYMRENNRTQTIGRLA